MEPWPYIENGHVHFQSPQQINPGLIPLAPLPKGEQGSPPLHLPQAYQVNEISSSSLHTIPSLNNATNALGEQLANAYSYLVNNAPTAMSLGNLNPAANSTKVKFPVTRELNQVAKNILTRKHKNGYKAALWNSLHGIADQLPTSVDEKKERGFKNLLQAVADSFPCDVCGEHLHEYLIVNPVRCKTREEANRYVYELHNFVNMRVGLPVLSYDEAMKIQRENANIDWTAAEKLLKDIARTPPIESSLIPAEASNHQPETHPGSQLVSGTVNSSQRKRESSSSHVSFRLKDGDTHNTTLVGGKIVPFLVIVGGLTLIALWVKRSWYAKPSGTSDIDVPHVKQPGVVQPNVQTSAPQVAQVVVSSPVEASLRQGGIIPRKIVPQEMREKVKLYTAKY